MIKVTELRGRRNRVLSAALSDITCCLFSPEDEDGPEFEEGQLMFFEVGTSRVAARGEG